MNFVERINDDFIKKFAEMEHFVPADADYQADYFPNAMQAEATTFLARVAFKKFNDPKAFEYQQICFPVDLRKGKFKTTK